MLRLKRANHVVVRGRTLICLHCKEESDLVPMGIGLISDRLRVFGELHADCKDAKELTKSEVVVPEPVYIVRVAESGYYYTAGNGRYGRVNGLKANAETLCEKHANEIAEVIRSADVSVVLEEVATRGCMVCQRRK